MQPKFKRWRLIGLLLSIVIPGLIACGEVAQQATLTTGEPAVPYIEPAFGEKLASGQALFGQYCANCHGQSGEGMGPFPALNDGMHAYSHPDWELISLIRDGKNSMPAFGSQLSEDEIITIIARVKAWWGPGKLSEQRQLCLISPGPTPTLMR
ncbi:c-type cytochrome [Herpetosiphon sp. NSE202]|uniref:c-type cytochrome n=1 Tax=Herpetosiphon sp. NSE202 TaxID=3351349 RepID=UPI0036396680